MLRPALCRLTQLAVIGILRMRVSVGIRRGVRPKMDNTAQVRPRRAERISKRIPISLVVKTDGKESRRSGSTLDVSTAGLRVQTIRPLYQGQAVYLLPTKGEASSGYYRVVWVRQTAESTPPEAGLQMLN